MTNCLAIRHVTFEDLGLLTDVLAEHGFSPRYLDAGIDTIDAATLLAPDLVVVLGGPIGVYEDALYPFLREEIAAIGARLDAARPTLGICLGAQLMAKALGADVRPGPEKEIGWGKIELTEHGRRSVLAPFEDVPVLHWHGDNFAMPDGALRLASTRACPNQAFAVGRSVLGLQFHIEADIRRLERWLIGHAVELAKSGIDARDIRRQTLDFGATTAKAGREVFSAWLKQALGR